MPPPSSASPPKAAASAAPNRGRLSSLLWTHDNIQPRLELISRTGSLLRLKQTVGDQCRSTATVANTVAKPLDNACPVRTALEYRPSLRPVMDGLGRCAHSYGSDGHRLVIQEQPAPSRDIRGMILDGGQSEHAKSPGRELRQTMNQDALENH